MAKRFTATEKWDDPFFCELDITSKLIWLYLLDKCDSAGIYDVNIRLMRFHISTEITEEKLLKTFEGRIQVLNGGSKWFIPKFIEFQYKELSKNCKPHIPVLEKLKKYGLIERVSKGYPKGIQTLKEQVQEKDKEKDKEMESADHLRSDSRPTLAEVTEYFTGLGYPATEAENFWSYYDGLGWETARGGLIKNWQSKVMGWMNNSKQFSSNNGNGKGENKPAIKTDGIKKTKEMLKQLNTPPELRWKPNQQ